MTAELKQCILVRDFHTMNQGLETRDQVLQGQLEEIQRRTGALGEDLATSLSQLQAVAGRRRDDEEQEEQEEEDIRNGGHGQLLTGMAVEGRS